MASLTDDAGLLRALYGVILRNPIMTDHRYVDQRDVSVLQQFQRSWARDEIQLTTNWWRMTRHNQSNSRNTSNSRTTKDERFVRESDTYGKFSESATNLAQSSLQGLDAKMHVMKRESDLLKNELGKANEKIDDFHQRFRSLRDENEYLRKASSQLSSDRAEVSRVLKEKHVMRERTRELEVTCQKLQTELARCNARELLAATNNTR